jgi:hypothetical protein
VGGAFSSFRYAAAMEDGPEAAEGTYQYGEKTYNLDERQSEVWTVLDGKLLLGTVRALPAVDDRGPLYAVDVPGETETEDVPTDDWNSAVEYIIDQSS